ncbi:hypothetical protein HDU99_004097, partial [Rhizoclosmatium hyalinum]
MSRRFLDMFKDVGLVNQESYREAAATGAGPVLSGMSVGCASGLGTTSVVHNLTGNPAGNSLGNLTSPTE